MLWRGELELLVGGGTAARRIAARARGQTRVGGGTRISTRRDAAAATAGDVLMRVCCLHGREVYDTLNSCPICPARHCATVLVRHE